MKHQINSVKSLQAAIIELEQRHEVQGKLLKEQFLQAYESAKPINLIKNTLKEIAVSKELKDNIISTAIGLVVGFIYNLVAEKLTNTPLKKILSTTLIAGIGALLDKNSDTLKSLGNELLKMFKSKSKDRQHEIDPEDMVA